MKKSMLVVGILLVVPAMAMAAPKMSLSWAGQGATATADTAISEVTGISGVTPFWLNVVLDRDGRSDVGAFGGSLTTNAAGVGAFKVTSRVASSNWDYSATLTNWVIGATPLRNIGATSALVDDFGAPMDPADDAFPIVLTIKVTPTVALNANTKYTLDFINPGGGLNWGSMVTGAGGNFAPGDLKGLVINPEPVSLVLLAVGGLFLRRRMA